MFIDICDKALQTNAAYEKNTKIREYKVISRRKAHAIVSSFRELYF